MIAGRFGHKGLCQLHTKLAWPKSFLLSKTAFLAMVYSSRQYIEERGNASQLGNGPWGLVLYVAVYV